MSTWALSPLVRLDGWWLVLHFVLIEEGGYMFMEMSHQV